MGSLNARDNNRNDAEAFGAFGLIPFDKLTPEQQKLATFMGHTIGLAIDGEEIAEKARRDPLTGLLTKEAWREELTTRVEEAERSGGGLAVLFIDLKDFKRVNDQKGHVAGDNFIKAFAQKLTSSLRTEANKDREPRETDIISNEPFYTMDDEGTGRFGGDEFSVILQGVKDQETLDSVIERLKHEIHQDPELLDNGVTMSIGGSVWQPGIAPVDILEAADQAMFKDKAIQTTEQGSYR